MWATGLESNKEIVRKQKRRKHNVSNIYVVKDSKNPEKEGKVFKFVYGKKLFEKLTTAMNPQFEDEEAFDPFDLWKGANFKLKVRKVDGYQNYDASEFDSVGPLFDDDAKMEAVWKQQYSLLDIVDPKNFKSYADLEARLKRVLGQTSSNVQARTAEQYTAQSVAQDTPATQSQTAVTSNQDVNPAFDEDDDDMSYFSKLVAND